LLINVYVGIIHIQKSSSYLNLPVLS